MVFEPVWVSSISHLESFAAVFANTGVFRRLFGLYVVPDHFHYIQAAGLLRIRVPIVMFASGRALVEVNTLEFVAAPSRRIGVQYHNLQTELTFRLTDRDVTAIESFEWKSPLLRYYDLRFVRIRTKQTGVSSDLLLCVGGSGPFMGRIHARTAELAGHLSEAFPAASRLMAES